MIRINAIIVDPHGITLRIAREIENEQGLQTVSDHYWLSSNQAEQLITELRTAIRVAEIREREKVP